jgi:hypothetical protein
MNNYTLTKDIRYFLASSVSILFAQIGQRRETLAALYGKQGPQRITVFDNEEVSILHTCIVVFYERKVSTTFAGGAFNLVQSLRSI